MSLEQLGEMQQLIAWLHNSAAHRLPSIPHLEAVAASAATADGAGSRAAGSSAGVSDAMIEALTSSVATLRDRAAYEHVLSSLQALTLIAQRRVRLASSDMSSSPAN